MQFNNIRKWCWKSAGTPTPFSTKEEMARHLEDNQKKTRSFFSKNRNYGVL